VRVRVALITLTRTLKDQPLPATAGVKRTTHTR